MSFQYTEKRKYEVLLTLFSVRCELSYFYLAYPLWGQLAYNCVDKVGFLKNQALPVSLHKGYARVSALTYQARGDDCSCEFSARTSKESFRKKDSP